MKTTVTLTQHYKNPGSTNGRDWIRHDFKTDDGQKFQTFDGDLASQVVAYLNQPVELEYQPQERGQYVNNEIKSVAPLSNGAAPAAVTTAYTTPPAAYDDLQTQINRSAGLARAIEFTGVSGESILEAFDNGSLFELALTFAQFCQTGEYPGAVPSSEAPVEAVA